MKTLPSLLIAASVSIGIRATPCVAQTPPPAASQQQQQPRPPLTFAPSGRATTEISVTGGQGARITIDYGQPHASGRVVFGTLVPLDSVWRAGANRATQLTTDVALNIGGTTIPAGSYSLALYVSRTAPRLIINSRTRQWGIPYNPAGEIARVPMRVRTLTSPVESFSIALVPNAAAAAGAPPAPAGGVLTMTWGTMQFSVDFTLQP